MGHRRMLIMRAMLIESEVAGTDNNNEMGDYERIAGGEWMYPSPVVVSMGKCTSWWFAD